MTEHSQTIDDKVDEETVDPGHMDPPWTTGLVSLLGVLALLAMVLHRLQIL